MIILAGFVILIGPAVVGARISAIEVLTIIPLIRLENVNDQSTGEGSVRQSDVSRLEAQNETDSRSFSFD